MYKRTPDDLLYADPAQLAADQARRETRVETRARLIAARATALDALRAAKDSYSAIYARFNRERQESAQVLADATRAYTEACAALGALKTSQSDAKRR